MKQLEEFEEELGKLKAERDGAKRSEIETKSKIEAMKFENELLKKRLESGTKDKSDSNSREDGLVHQIESLGQIIKQREQAIEEKVQENFGLKQTIDQIRMERDKLKKRGDDLEDVIRQKEMEIS